MAKLFALAATALAALALASVVQGGVAPYASIDDGARYTRSAKVQLRIQPPPGATAAEISNDEAFTTPTRVEMAGQVAMSWTLLASGADGTRTVFVRFSGYDVDPAQVYSDAIVLDRTRPVLRSAEAGPLPTRRGHGKRGVSAAGQARCGFLLYTTFRDNLSKVRAIEYRFKRTGARRSVKANRIVRVVAPARRPRPKRLFVRVRDGAGNRSSSRRVDLRSTCR